MCTGVCETAHHEIMKADETWWQAQRLIGVQPIDERECLVMRNCGVPGCESTLARVEPMTLERVAQIEESLRRAREFSDMVRSLRAA